MGTITVASLFDKAATVLNDAGNVRWTTTELLGWLNDGQRAITIIKPNASVSNASVQLVAGTKQAIPAGGVQLIDVPRNMGSAGTDPGLVVRLTDRANLDAYLPNWHNATASASVQHYMFDPRDPKHFYVYPPQPASGMGYVEIISAVTPADCVIGTGTVITLDDIYEPVLLDYMLFRGFSKDSEFSADQGRAGAHQTAFFTALGVKVQAEAGLNPNINAPAKAAQTG